MVVVVTTAVAGFFPQFSTNEDLMSIFYHVNENRTRSISRGAFVTRTTTDAFGSKSPIKRVTPYTETPAAAPLIYVNLTVVYKQQFRGVSCSIYIWSHFDYELYHFYFTGSLK